MVDLYTSYSGVLIVVSVLLPIVVSLLHYQIVGSKGVSLNADMNVIQRFSMSEHLKKQNNK